MSFAQVAKFIITTLNVGVFGFLIMFQPTFPLIYHKNEGSTNFCVQCYKRIYGDEVCGPPFSLSFSRSLGFLQMRFL